MNWNLWLFAVALLSLVLPFFRRGRSRLRYLVSSHKPLVTVRDDVVGNIEVRFRGRKINALHLIEFAFINTGNRPIRAADFERPLTIFLPHATELFDVSLNDRFDGCVGAKISVSEHRLSIEPLLLNPRESVALRLLVNEVVIPWRLYVRIAGITEVSEVVDHPRVNASIRRFWWWVLAMCGAVILLHGVLQALDVTTPEVLAKLSRVAAFTALLPAIILSLMHAESTFLRSLRRVNDALPGYGLLDSVGVGEDHIDRGVPTAVVGLHRAVYGAGDAVVDVTDRLRARFANGRLDVVASNELAGGDPAPNFVKQLRIDYTVGGETATRVVTEGSRVELP